MENEAANKVKYVKHTCTHHIFTYSCVNNRFKTEEMKISGPTNAPSIPLPLPPRTTGVIGENQL
jgi:hypothetical protein